MARETYQARNSEFHLTPDELARLIVGAPTERDRLIIEVLAFTGIRRAEVCALTLSDIDVAHHRLIVRHGKGGKQRIVFVPPEVAARIASFGAAHGGPFVFPGRNQQRMSLRNMNYILTRAGERAGITTPNPRYVAVGPHLIRHSFARNWKRNGGSIESLQKLLGHASAKTTLDCYGTEDMREVEANYRNRCAQLVTEHHFPLSPK